VEENSEPVPVIEFTKVKLTVSDLKDEYQALNEDHVTEQYVVEEGKMFEGMKVLEKYEILFYKNITSFIVQQLARFESNDVANTFLDTLKNKTIMPGVMSDYNFFDVDIEIIGNDSLLKENTSIIEGNSTQIYMLVFRIDNIVTILVSGFVNKEDIIEYAHIIENRMNSTI